MVALITFGIVALAVGGLVDVLTRQGVRTAHANAEARNLARLAARAMTSPRDLSEARRAGVRKRCGRSGVRCVARPRHASQRPACCSGLTSRFEWNDRAAGLQGQQIQIRCERMFALRSELDQNLWRKRQESNRV